MEWLTSLLSGPYAEARWAALATPVLIGIWAAFNVKPSTRKGLHPFTKFCLWTFGAVTLFVAIIWFGQVFGLISSPSASL